MRTWLCEKEPPGGGKEVGHWRAGDEWVEVGGLHLTEHLAPQWDTSCMTGQVMVMKPPMCFSICDAHRFVRSLASELARLDSIDLIALGTTRTPT